MNFTSRSAFVVPVLAAALFACTSATTPEEATPGGQPASEESAATTTTAGAPGSHMGQHGMILFGGEKVYLSHIPLFQSPHNLQVVVEAKITAGVTPEQQKAFASRGYSLRPAGAWSLYDLAHGTLRSIGGTVHLGDFEQGGPVAFRNVKLEVTRVLFAQTLVPTTPARPTLDYLAVGSPTEPYLVHVIDAQTSFDSVVAVKLPANSFLNAASLEAGTLVRIANGVNTVAGRLNTDAVVEASLIDAPVVPVAPEPACPPSADGGITEPPPAVSSSIAVTGERMCLLGNDFYQSCPAP